MQRSENSITFSSLMKYINFYECFAVCAHFVFQGGRLENAFFFCLVALKAYYLCPHVPKRKICNTLIFLKTFTPGRGMNAGTMLMSLPGP